MGRSLIFPAFVLMLACVVASENEGKRIFRQCKPFPQPLYDAFPHLLEFVRSVAWFFGNLFSAVYYLLDKIVITLCEIISSIFSCVKYAIKLVEYIGCGVKTILQVNYNFVSSLFEGLAKAGRFISDLLRSFSQAVRTGLTSTFQGLVSWIHRVINWIPAGFYQASIGAQAATNVTGSILYQSYLGWKYVLKTPVSALSTVAITVRAVIECLLVSAWNTGLLLLEILCSFLASIFLGIESVGKSIITCSTSTWNKLIAFSKWFLFSIRALLYAIGQNTLNVFNTISWAISFTFSTSIRGLYLTSNSICWLVSTSLTELGRYFIKCIETLINAASLAVHYSPVGRWTVMVLALVGFLPIYSWAVLRVNVFSVTFELLETSLQDVLAFVTSFQVPSFPTQVQVADGHEQLRHVPKDERNSNLMEQLERERDQNLCVVCQTEKKNIVVMPCRHMCMCKNCCAQLFRTQRYQRKTCPLCRNIITSTMEIYA